MLKLYTLILILISLAALEARPNIGSAHEICQARYNVTTKEMDDLYGVLPQGTDGIDRKFKCFSKCLLDELEYKDENGKINFKRIVDINSHHRGNANALQITADCEAKHDLETDECERTFKIMACMALALKNKTAT